MSQSGEFTGEWDLHLVYLACKMLFVLNIFIFHLVPPLCVHTSNQHGVTCSSEVKLKVKTFNCQVAMGTLFCITPDWLTNGILVMESITACSHFYSNTHNKSMAAHLQNLILSLLVPQAYPWTWGVGGRRAHLLFHPVSEPSSCAGTMSGPQCAEGLTWRK